jgi:hypothetical protein
VVFAAFDLRDGVEEVEAAREALGPEDLATPEPAQRLGRARVAFARADARLSNPLLAPVRWFPVVGRQLRTVAALADTAHTVAEVGQRAAVDADAALEAGSTAGPDRVRLLDRMGEIVGRARLGLGDVDLGPSEALFGAVRERRARFEQELVDARRGLEDAQAGLTALRDLLGGDGARRYLVLAGNNAEMRAGSAAFLSIGVLETADGRLQLGEFEPAGDLRLDPPGVGLEADVAARWGWAEPGREWRNLGLTPRFDVTGTTAAAMWEQRTGEVVDGVLALDVAAVAALLEATGPIEVDGERVTADDVGPLLMHDQYDEGAELGGAQIERRERLGELAGAAVTALEEGDVDLGTLAASLTEAAAGRHVLLWARAAPVQAGWAAVGLAGEVPADALLVGVINRGANKLDPFLAVQATFATGPADGGSTEVAVRVEIENRTPEGENPYVAGPNPETGTSYGDYRGILALTLPGAATSVRFDEDRPLVVAGPDGEAKVAGVELRLPAGGRDTFTLRFVLPGRSGSVRLLPSARLLPNEWRRDGVEDFNDGLGRTLPW